MSHILFTTNCFLLGEVASEYCVHQCQNCITLVSVLTRDEAAESDIGPRLAVNPALGHFNLGLNSATMVNNVPAHFLHRRCCQPDHKNATIVCFQWMWIIFLSLYILGHPFPQRIVHLSTHLSQLLKRIYLIV